MRKDDLVYVGHMLDTAYKALEKTRGKSRADYEGDENLRFTLAYFIQIIGEAARRVSAEFQKQHKEIPWENIIGMRHKIVHDYMHVEFDIVWDVIEVDLPPLVEALEKIMAP